MNPPIATGAIEPHRGRFPPAVEDALFAMLLAPWEDWGGRWRAFEVPWVYAVDDDLFVRPKQPPSADYVLGDDEKEAFFDARRVLLKDGGARISEWLTDRRWAELLTAWRSELFQTPVKHFFVKAFLEEPADEFLAHITTIEAALGLKSDYESRGATGRVAARVSALLGAPIQGKDYRELFNFRCTYLHGRSMGPISSDSRLLARRLARQVVGALVEAALDPSYPQSREEYLKGLRS